jgi:ribosomal protein S18 acetylase RimI-like enzyme/ribosomal protein S27AE
MLDQLTIRGAERDDIARVREIARDSLTSSYALSPDDIEMLVEVAFAEDALAECLDDAAASLLVAEDDGIVGFVTTTDGEVDWLHVDPERRGRGAGTALFERAVETLDDGSGPVQATTLAANTQSGAFFERFDFERVAERQTELGSLELAEYVYAPAGATERESDSGREADAAEAAEPTERDDLDLPDEVTVDGRTVTLGDESVPGSEGGFVVTYDGSEAYGYLCANCESMDVTVDSMNRIRCGHCGNTHRPKEEYDGSYL